MTAWRRAALLAASLLVAAGCAQPGGPPRPGDGSGSWRELPAPPLSPRQMAVTAWTGTEALFIGGDLGPPCPRGAACDRMPQPARDGAAYDPATDTWRRIADAPLPVGLSPWTAVVGDAVFLIGQDPVAGPSGARLLSYDAGSDEWSVHEPPPGGLDGVQLTAVGDRVLAARGERRAGDPPDQLYDPAARTWTAIPEDPLGPSFDRVYVGTPQLVVLIAKELVPDPGVEPSFVHAALLDPVTLQWMRRIDDSEIVGGWRWTWTGRRLVDATLGEVDGGEVNNYGRAYPLGGVLDLRAGGWGPLPDPLTSSVEDDPVAAGAWPVEAVGGPFTALGGWIYDDRDESWTRLAPPEGAPRLPGSAVWAGDALVVLGGGGNGELSGDAWLYRLAAGDDQPVAPGDSEQLIGDWEFVDGTSGGAAIPQPPGRRATLSADGYQVTGTAFCNGYGGSYRVDGATMRLEDVFNTDMACTDAMDAESAFLTVLTAGDLRVRVSGDDLALENDQGMLRFHRQTPVPTADLVGTRWVLDTLLDGEVASSTVGEPAVLELSDDGTFTAGTGCRDLRGRWQAAGDTVTLDYQWPEASCPPDVEAQEQHVIAALGSGFRAEIDGDRLTVSGPAGQGLVYQAG